MDLVPGEALCHHQKHPLGQSGTSSWMMHSILGIRAAIPRRVLAGCTPGSLRAARPPSHSGSGTAGSGQPNKYIFKLMSLNIEHCRSCASFFPPSPNKFFFFLIFTNKLFQLKKEISFSDSTGGELSMTRIPICFSSPFKSLGPV